MTAAPALTPEERANVGGRLERLPYSSAHSRLFWAQLVCFTLGSVGLGTTTFLLPDIAREFALSPTMAGLVGTAKFLGMFIGAGGAGLIADRMGRKTLLLWGIALWALGSFLLSWSPGAALCYAGNVILGLGMGAHFPMAQALLSEVVPAARRGRAIALLEGGFPLSFLLGGAVSWAVLGVAGWRWVFFIQGLGGLCFFVARSRIPESVRWLESAGRTVEADRLMTRLEDEVREATGAPLPPVPALRREGESGRFSFFELFSGPYRRRTVMIWSLWFTALFGFYSLTTWLSALLVAAGFTVVKSTGFIVLMSLPGIPGYMSAAWLVDVLGRRATTAGYVLLSAVACHFYGQAASFSALIAWGAVMQFFMFGMWSLLYTYSPELYPTRARATGCGFASSLGRLGALIGPFVVGAVIERAGPSGVFTLGAAMYTVGALVVLLLGPETRGKALEELSH